MAVLLLLLPNPPPPPGGGCAGADAACGCGGKIAAVVGQ